VSTKESQNLDPHLFRQRRQLHRIYMPIGVDTAASTATTTCDATFIHIATVAAAATTCASAIGNFQAIHPSIIEQV
jgi:hypothetical protein